MATQLEAIVAKRDAAYIRESSEEQGEGFSPAAQRKNMHEWTQENGIEATEEYCDAGESSAEQDSRGMTLDAGDIESIAARVVALLREEMPSASRLADAAEVARELGVDRDWVYAHAEELGGARLGGARGRLRFDLVRIRRDLACPAGARSRPTIARRPRRQPPTKRRSNVELIPYSEVRSSTRERA
jgi:hypothetical protein